MRQGCLSPLARLQGRKLVVIEDRANRHSSLIDQVSDCVFIDLTQLLGKGVEVCAMHVGFRNLVAEFRHLKHCLECLELREQLLMHFLLPVDDVVANFDFTPCV